MHRMRELTPRPAPEARCLAQTGCAESDRGRLQEPKHLPAQTLHVWFPASSDQSTRTELLYHCNSITDILLIPHALTVFDSAAYVSTVTPGLDNPPKHNWSLDSPPKQNHSDNWGRLIDTVKVLHPTRHKIGHSETLPKPIAWRGLEKLKLTQQKYTFTDQKKCTTTQNKHNKLKPGSLASYDIRPGNVESLFWFRRFINLSLTYLLRTLTHLPTALGPTRGNWGMFSTCCPSCHPTNNVKELKRLKALTPTRQNHSLAPILSWHTNWLGWERYWTLIILARSLAPVTVYYLCGSYTAPHKYNITTNEALM